MVLSTSPCELSIKPTTDAFPLNRPISFVFFVQIEKAPGFHESKERDEGRVSLGWRRAGGTLHTQVQRERFPTCKPPTDTHNDRIGHLQHTLGPYQSRFIQGLGRQEKFILEIEPRCLVWSYYANTTVMFH